MSSSSFLICSKGGGLFISLRDSLRVRRSKRRKVRSFRMIKHRSHHHTVLSGSCQAVVRQFSGTCQAVLTHHPVMCKAGESYEGDIRQLSSNHQAVIRQSSNCHFVIHCTANDTHSHSQWYYCTYVSVSFYIFYLTQSTYNW